MSYIKMICLAFFSLLFSSIVKAQPLCDSCFADMHYHISMRAYNLHGQEATQGKVNGTWIEEHSERKLKLRYNGYYVRPKRKSTNAHLKTFSQATLPHTMKGKV